MPKEEEKEERLSFRVQEEEKAERLGARELKLLYPYMATL